MDKRINSVLVLGLGKVGYLVALLLHETGFKVTGADVHPVETFPFPVHPLDVTSHADLTAALKNHEAIISCLPYHFNVAVARVAAQCGVHYFDLTEDVGTTRAISEMSKTTPTVMAPQCGLAPGFIAIVGASLARKFDKIRSIKLRVGALPKHPTGLLGYAFNWSPEGVVNEYLNDCEVIEGGVRKWVSPLEWLEMIVINGLQLEAFTTSGGLGTMCETYHGLVENLDYKSIRYPGHAALMNFFLHELLMREDRAHAGKILVNAKPPVSEDVVYIHASAEGWQNGNLNREEFVRAYSPIEIAGKMRRTIAWTTAASICSVVEMVSSGALPEKGFIKQEEIPLATFLATHNGRLYDGRPHGGRLI
ncbi:L-lysine dehydrogenase [Desulfopila sp. IMCC35006]|uniref:saccharopine dehydrogenase family protein n=1 Tax=Desulfopila sp. IMCC35006 TaxID=2569542 RepID=UPI0010ACC824|nr:saccharopine dehydrogenase C-terminal domain-containing protein [Desulfopila sp. IMCC35006]TKB24418.1 L-lysine dehydrogenase [Desulfopila sp. IMCC35006]